MIKIQFFASLRERLGQAKMNVEYNGELTVEALKQQLLTRGEDWQALSGNNVLCALNQSICKPDTIINDGDEIAFFPPVTGG
ncbi:molybdopterin synthase sulfur carrier subunit [Paraglaciecola mesophila KMM 241]|uniref:Molybdopterin synthase sulfur carrier subunit n=1 Tax=Paraglaciecola mesophila KMM 241 TaxID=1128912 RepID=K6ZM16_9ALTE|nr:molybdopterin converting factor subunit 1 [Paraglaciecola mesophila]GAC24400.1 molybdopterin synthase sulfur carrier subunit [Paraglaciecola mesophila KMM 241]